jgi:hypothetical protein
MAGLLAVFAEFEREILANVSAPAWPPALRGSHNHRNPETIPATHQEIQDRTPASD